MFPVDMVHLKTNPQTSVTYLGEVRDVKSSKHFQDDSSPSPKSPQASWGQVEMLCARKGWPIQKLADEASISRTTLHHWASGNTTTPQIKTVSKVAEALGVPVKTLFATSIETEDNENSNSFLKFDDSFIQERRLFDRSTNTLVDQIVLESPEVFSDWKNEQWDELYSCFGVGGQLSEEGVREMANEINSKKETVHQIEILMETHLKETVKELINSLYKTIEVTSSSDVSPQSQANKI